MSAKTEYYNTGGGELYFTPIVNGVLGIEKPFGQTEDIKFSTSVEKLTHDNTEGTTTFEDISVLKKVTGSINIDTVEISPDMLTTAFLGTSFVTQVGASTATEATVAISALDTVTPIGKKILSEVIVQNEAKDTTYVEGTDYVIDYQNGTINALSTGAISVGNVVVTFDNGAYEDIRVEAFLNSKIEGVLRFVGKSATGVSYVYTFHKVSLIASGDFSLKSATEFAKLSFEGAMLASDLITANGVSKLFKIEGARPTA